MAMGSEKGRRHSAGGSQLSQGGGASQTQTPARKKSNPLIFLREVRSEAARVTWPTRNETVVTTIMVFIMVFLASIFFLLADQFLSWAVGSLFQLFA